MTKRNVMEALNITPDGSLPKNPYDLSSYEYIHSKMGQFLPVGCRETVPDGIYRFSVDATTMTLPCNTASFSHMKENYYFLFVPYSQLTSTAYSFFPNRKDNQSALDYGYTKMPFFPLGDVVAYLLGLYDTARTGQAGDPKDIHGFGLAQGALKLLDLLGYGSYLDYAQYIYQRDENGNLVYNLDKRTAYINALKTKLNAYKPNALRLAAYQKIWYCYFRNPQYDTDVSPRCFNFDDVTYTSDGTEPNYDIVAKRGVASFVSECLQLRYVGYKKDIFTGSMPGTQWGAVSSISMNGSAVLSGSTQFIGTRENGENGSWQGASINNVVSNDGTFDDDVSSNNQLIQGDINNNDAALYNRNASETTSSPRYVQLRTSHSHSLNGTINLSSMKLFDVLQLVEAEAIQKWRQKSMLAGQRAINQYRAHYGIVPRHMQDHYPDFIGSVDNTIDVSQVVSQANTATQSDESNLGDIGGRGYGSIRPKTFEYHASEHGILMLCRAIVPDNLYSSYGIDRANELIYYTDFWQPELQNIGLEAVPKELLNATVTWNQNPETGDASNFITQGRIIGYAPRNYQLKQYPSRVHGMFNPSRIGSFHVPTAINAFGFSDFQAFVQTRGDLVSKSAFNTSDINFAVLYMTISRYYVNPSMANNTFAVDADSYEDTDQFIHAIRFNCDAVQPLTPLGLPMF